MDNNINKDVIVEESYSPLGAPVIKRDYTGHNHSTNPNEPVEELEEPSFQPPSFDEDEENDDDPSQTEEQEPKTFNPQFTELDDKEKKQGAKKMAEVFLDMYTKGCGFIGKIPSISESKIDGMISEKEIDADATVPTQNGDVPIKEYAVAYNESLQEAFEVTDEFKEKVTPPLVRILQKRSLALTDEQMLIYFFSTDLIDKGAKAFMLRKNTMSLLDAIKENTSELRAQKARQNAPYRPEPAPAPTQPTEPVHYYTEEIINHSDAVSRPVENKNRTNLDEQVETWSEANESPAFANVSQEIQGFASDFVEPATNPTFGDVTVLKTMEDISNGNVPSNRKVPPRRRNKPTKNN